MNKFLQSSRSIETSARYSLAVTLCAPPCPSTRNGVCDRSKAACVREAPLTSAQADALASHSHPRSAVVCCPVRVLSAPSAETVWVL